MELITDPGWAAFDPENTASIAKGELADSLIKLDTKFRQEAKSYRASQPIRNIRHGTTPLIISAPHATPHTRHGSPKSVEHITGVLAMALARSLNATVILPIAPQPDDPNFDTDESAPYKHALASLLSDCKLLVDIHGMRDYWGDDICVGTGRLGLSPQENQLIEAWGSAASAEGFALVIDHPFASCSQGTISTFARKHGCEALQLELAAHLRQANDIADTFQIIQGGLIKWLGIISQHQGRSPDSG